MRPVLRRSEREVVPRCRAAGVGYGVIVINELGLGLRLVLRERSFLLVSALWVVVLLPLVFPTDSIGVSRTSTGLLWILAGFLGAISAAALFRREGPWESVRAAHRRCIAVALNRFSTVVVVTLAPVLPVVLLSSPPGGVIPRMVLVAGALSLAVTLGAQVAWLTPLWGASSALGLGLLASLFGLVRPDWLESALGGWFALSGVLVGLWNLLPLPWRISAWVAGEGLVHLALMAVWTVAALSVLVLLVARGAYPRGL